MIEGNMNTAMEQEAPRYTAMVRERALEDGFYMGSTSQKLVLFRMQLACA